MGLSALVVEREAHVGDSWRQRYDLKLHTYSRICSFLYESYPTNFPLYMPRDRLADALEAYVTSQDLVVWTSTTVLPSPTYDEKSRRWSVVVMREGKEVRLRPKYIVMATGFAGEPNMPSWPGENIYKGVIYHSGRHPGGQHFAGKNVVVVGAGQSAADMCVDFVRHGAGNITMLQRSATQVFPLVERHALMFFLQVCNEPSRRGEDSVQSLARDPLYRGLGLCCQCFPTVVIAPTCSWRRDCDGEGGR